jgi:hypothetical protein
MKRGLLFCAAILLTSPVASAPANPPVADSKLAHSSVSLAVDPQLNDGRVVVRIAAKNSTTAPVSFGPTSVSIAKPSGETIALISLQQLIDDVRVAAGMPAQPAPGQALTAGAYTTAQVQVDSAGHPDVSGYTGGSAVAPAETVRRSNQPSPKSKPSIDRATAETQIAALKQAVLQDTTIQASQISVAQVVSQKVKFKKGEDRTLYLRVRIAGDEHSFTIAAPAD